MPTYSTQATACRTVVAGVKLKMPLSRVAYQDCRRDRGADVERQGVQARKERCLLQVVQAVGQDAGGDEDEQDPGVAEELRQVDAHRALVDRDPEGDRGAEPDDPADQRLCGARAGGLGGGVEEDRRLQALAADAEEADERHGPWADVDRPVQLALELARDGAGRRAHPEHHAGHEGHRQDRGRAAHELLGLEGQLARAVGQEGAEQHRERDGHPDAGPDPAQGPAAVGLDQKSHEDDDDEGGLEAFTEPDEGVADKHGT